MFQTHSLIRCLIRSKGKFSPGQCLALLKSLCTTAHRGRQGSAATTIWRLRSPVFHQTALCWSRLQSTHRSTCGCGHRHGLLPSDEADIHTPRLPCRWNNDSQCPPSLCFGANGECRRQYMMLPLLNDEGQCSEWLLLHEESSPRWMWNLFGVAWLFICLRCSILLLPVFHTCFCRGHIARRQRVLSHPLGRGCVLYPHKPHHQW